MQRVLLLLNNVKCDRDAKNLPFSMHFMENLRFHKIHRITPCGRELVEQNNNIAKRINLNLIQLIPSLQLTHLSQLEHLDQDHEFSQAFCTAYSVCIDFVSQFETEQLLQTIIRNMLKPILNVIKFINKSTAFSGRVQILPKVFCSLHLLELSNDLHKSFHSHFIIEVITYLEHFQCRKV